MNYGEKIQRRSYLGNPYHFGFSDLYTISGYLYFVTEYNFMLCDKQNGFDWVYYIICGLKSYTLAYFIMLLTFNLNFHLGFIVFSCYDKFFIWTFV